MPISEMLPVSTEPLEEGTVQESVQAIGIFLPPGTSNYSKISYN